MKIFCRLGLCVLTVGLFACHKKAISQEETVRLIIQILYTEQQINHEISLSALADTCLIYEAILQKEGYTQAQFQQALQRHIRKPEEFKKALEEGRTRIRNIKSQLQAQLRPKRGIDTALLRTLYVFRHYGDSLPPQKSIMDDSLTRVTTFLLPLPDTLLPPQNPFTLLLNQPVTDTLSGFPKDTHREDLIRIQREMPFDMSEEPQPAVEN